MSITSRTCRQMFPLWRKTRISRRMTSTSADEYAPRCRLVMPARLHRFDQAAEVVSNLAVRKCGGGLVNHQLKPACLRILAFDPHPEDCVPCFARKRRCSSQCRLKVHGQSDLHHEGLRRIGSDRDTWNGTQMGSQP